MKKTVLIFIVASIFFAFNSDDEIVAGTKQAWYETSQEIPFDKNISSLKSGEFYFEFHPELQPKNLNNQPHYRDKTKTSDYFVSYLINNSDDTISINRQDGSVIMIQEAKNSVGIWTPIEHWLYSTCGNSYFDPLKLEPSFYVAIPILKYQGDFKTEIRLKLRDGEQLIYSDSFEGSVEKSQFRNSDNNKVANQPFNINYLDSAR